MRVLAIAVVGFACGGSSEPSRPPPATGPQLIVERMPSAKQAAVVVLFPIGSDHDPPGKSGLAHLVEHVFVTAASGATPVRSAEVVMTQGTNAQTGARYTVIGSLVAPDRIEPTLADLASRMTAIEIGAADLDRERPRLAGELANMQDRWPLAACNAARQHVRPIDGTRPGGVRAEIDAISAAEVSDRVRRYYRANHAIIAIVGDIDEATTRAAASRAFADAPTGEPLPVAREPGPPHAGRHAIEGSAQGAACVAWRMPALPDPRLPELLALSGRLLSGVAVEDVPAASLSWPILDQPEVLTVALPATSDLDRTLARLSSALTEASHRHGIPLPFVASRNAVNPYTWAFALARWRQLGVDVGKLPAAVDAVPDRRVAELSADLLAIDRAAIVVTR